MEKVKERFLFFFSIILFLYLSNLISLFFFFFFFQSYRMGSRVLVGKWCKRVKYFHHRVSVDKVTSGDSLGVTVLTLLKKQIITQTVLQFWLYSAWIKIKADGPAAQLELMRWWSLKELVMMMEGRVMCVSPWGGSDWGWVQKRRNGFKCSKMRMLGKLGWKPCRTLGVIFLIRVKWSIPWPSL